MTNTELTKIREEKKLSKQEFASLLGVTAMLVGRYEKGSCAIPEEVAKPWHWESKRRPLRRQ